VMLGCDHYGGHHMHCMPSFCVALEASAMADVGGTPGHLRVPSELALGAVQHLRENAVDVAVSYKMVVDHGFSQSLVELTGGLDRYPVLPIFMACIQFPFVPLKRARFLGEQLSSFLVGLNVERLLVLATGGLSHDPSQLFPAVSKASPAWRPYIVDGPERQAEVSQERWLRHQDRAHRLAAAFLPYLPVPRSVLSIHANWDRAFLELLGQGRVSEVDGWRAEEIAAKRGVGTLEVATWVAATQCLVSLTGHSPPHSFYAPLRELGIGFGMLSSDIVAVRS
jgi:2,3-dihydroxyphenylpropionate 1,2-dioxygenase